MLLVCICFFEEKSCNTTPFQRHSYTPTPSSLMGTTLLFCICLFDSLTHFYLLLFMTQNMFSFLRIIHATFNLNQYKKAHAL